MTTKNKSSKTGKTDFPTTTDGNASEASGTSSAQFSQQRTAHGGRTHLLEAINAGLERREREAAESAAVGAGDASTPEGGAEGGETPGNSAPDPTDEATAAAAAGEGQPAGTDPEGDQGEPEPLTFAKVAEAVGLSETDLYDSLSVNIGDGEAVTLAEAKQRLQQIETDKRGIAAQIDQAEQATAQYIADVQALGVLDAMQAIPAPIRQQANQHLIDIAVREEQNFRALRPEMRDDQKFLAFREDAKAYLAESGLRLEDFPVLRVPMYQLMTRMLRDAKDAKAYRKPKPKPVPAKKPQSQPPAQPAANTAPLQGSSRQRFRQLANRRR